jgi:hypothetical protein
MTFDDAGSDRDLREQYLTDHVRRAWAEADALLSQARAAMETNPTNPAKRSAEQAAREALGRLASGLNWAEDSQLEQEAHDRMDFAGRWVRKTFGCFLHQEGAEYSQTCPIALGHNRIGLSIGGHAKRICSLCGTDLSACEHMRGRAYPVPGGTTDLGWCRVCTSKEGCGHQPDKMYRARVVAIVMEMELDEVSIVGKPAHPDARLTSVPINTAELQSYLGDDWSPGMPVNCDRCLMPCDGLVRHPSLHM